MNKAFNRRRQDLMKQIGDDVEFAVWLGLSSTEQLPEADRPMFFKWYGTCPQFILDSIQQWGGLTPKQYDFAQRKFNEGRTVGRTRYEMMQAQKNALIDKGYVWVAGRREVTLEILSIKERMWGPKLRGKTEQGMKLWVSLPNGAQAQKGSRIRMTVTVKPSEDDPTFAFGSRPSKWALI